ncbi:MAG: EamA/RhaT family transporter [Alphaproteobacteria bacterium HGW-Alphaproteobacteria-3]|jgi:drug/metabolite transporter (DMT)-like permease|nr:MAG: EamA/RhaT family transporter [Alphaproteobacteria bacterium HGW-Alphaproteobacteria-3]
MLGLLVALWGSAFAFARIAIETVAPEWTMAGRLVAGAALLLPLALGAGKVLPRESSHWSWLVSLALVGNIAPFFVISWGQQHVPSALAGILIGFTPLATLVIAHFLLADERITRLRAAGFATGFAGLVIVLGPSALADMASGGDRLLGQLAVLAGAFFFACNNVMARLAPEMPLLVKSSGVMVAGAVAGTVIAGTVTPPAALASASAASLLGVAGLGVFSTGLATLVFFRLVDRAGPAFVSLTNYLVPVFASLAGFFVFGEELNFRILTGLSLILAGIAVSEWRTTFKE